jgi:predicted nucleic acid-binding protein
MTFETPQSNQVGLLHKKNSNWQVPVLWKSEFLNVVALYFRKNIISFKEAYEAIDYAHRLIGVNEHRIGPHTTMELIATSMCSSYDCEFIALAGQLNTRLITYDKLILKEFPEIAINPENYLAQLK